MKKALLLLGLLLFASASFAGDEDAVVRWKTIVGVITAPLVNNPVAGIPSGLFPWRATGDKARVNLANGHVAFKVEGLVLVGTNFAGTRGDLTEVKGTLVCNPGTNTQAVIGADLRALELAGFIGSIQNTIRPAAFGSGSFCAESCLISPATLGQVSCTKVRRRIREMQAEAGNKEAEPKQPSGKPVN